MHTATKTRLRQEKTQPQHIQNELLTGWKFYNSIVV